MYLCYFGPGESDYLVVCVIPYAQTQYMCLVEFKVNMSCDLPMRPWFPSLGSTYSPHGTGADIHMGERQIAHLPRVVRYPSQPRCDLDGSLAGIFQQLPASNPNGSNLWGSGDGLRWVSMIPRRCDRLRKHGSCRVQTRQETLFEPRITHCHSGWIVLNATWGDNNV